MVDEFDFTAKFIAAGKQGLLPILLPRPTEILVQSIAKKSGKDMSTIISIALEHLASKILNDKEKAELIEKLKDLE